MSHTNVLIIMTDQQRKDSLGCYGNSVTPTPNLDRLAERGTRFERYYVANPICTPNRTSMFTGQHPRNHGTWTNGLLRHHECRTLMHELAERGYQTASIGKIHFQPLGGWQGERFDHIENMHAWRDRLKQGENTDELLDPCGPYWGFQHVELALGHTSGLAHYGNWFRANGGTPDMLERSDEGTRDIPEDLHDSAFIADRTINFLRNASADEPFFAVASFPDPHHPFDPPKETAGRYPLDRAEPSVGSPEDLETRPEHYRRHYRGEWHRSGIRDEAKHPDGWDEEWEKRCKVNTYAMVDLIDRNVGKILEALEEEGLTQNTLVIFTSDHGELLGDHGLWLKGPFFYEGLINVPFIAAGPGVAEGAVCSSLMSAVDLAPTVCSWLGFEPPQHMDGVDQTPVLAAPDERAREECLVEYRNGYGEHDVASMTLVTDTAKYTRYETGEEELTDLANDPGERRNVAGEPGHEAQTEHLRARLLDVLLSTQCDWPEQVSHA